MNEKEFNCCININDNIKGIEEVTKELEKIFNVPYKTCELDNIKKRRDLLMDSVTGYFSIEKVGNGFVTTVDIDNKTKSDISEYDGIKLVGQLIDEILDDIQKEEDKQYAIQELKAQLVELEE